MEALMRERRAVLGTGAVLVGMGTALLSGTAVAAADSGEDTGQPTDASAAPAAQASSSAPTRRSAANRTKTPAPATSADEAQADRATGVAGSDRVRVRSPKNIAPAPSAATAPAPKVTVPAAAVSEPAPLAQTVTAAPAATATAAAPSAPTPASAATLVIKALAALGRGPVAPGEVAAPAATVVTAQRQSAQSAAATGTEDTVAAAPPDPEVFAPEVFALSAVDPALPGYTNGVTGVQLGNSRLEIPGAFIGNTVDADWYFPTQADGTIDAQGVIWFQHGFGASNTFYSALVTDLARRTNSIVVAPTLTSIPFTLSGGCLTCAATEEAAAAAFLDPTRSALVESALAAGYTGDVSELLGNFALAGHSAGGGFSIAVASDYISAGSDIQDGNLVGVVMYDGVSNDAFSTGFAEQIAVLAAADKPTYQIAAPAQAWNAFGVTTNTLAALRPGEFTGVVLTGGSHVDSMIGSNLLFNFILQAVTQEVPAGNTAATYTLGTGWINDMYAGDTPQDAQYGFYAGANEAIMMGPTSAVGLPSIAANDMSFGDRLLTSVLGMFGITLPPPVTVVPNGVTGVVVPPLSNGVTGVRTASAILDIPCGDNGYPAPASWYFPTQADGTVDANGVIWLQHGFLGFNEWYSDMAIALAQETNSIVVAPSIFWFDNPICPGCYLGSPAIRVAAAEMFQGDRTELNVSANAAGLQGPLPEKFILTGHSAGGNFATSVAALLVDTPQVDNLLGVVMFDGVSRPPTFTNQLAVLDAAEKPDYQISAPPQRWNAWDIATESMEAAYPGRFNGLQIINGSHSDVIEGDTLFADLAEILSDIIVRPSPPGGKDAVRTLATGWVNDIYAGNTTYATNPFQPLYGIYGPDGEGPQSPQIPNRDIAMGQADAATLPAPPPVDLNQYAGKWYEQGSVRQFFSIGLVNTTATYTPLADGTVKVENFGQYFGPHGPAVTIVGAAVPVNAFNTRLNVGFGGLFGPAQPSTDEPGNYWILDYAPDYSWAIVGDPNGTSGYILTRDQFIPEAEYNALVAKAYQLGVNRLIIPTRQFPAPSSGAAVAGPESVPASVLV
ncbi:MAG: lipocalin family protein [Mycobacterium sp.]|nr:lipocalin family protein [Mycobacterium sp.]